MEKMAYLGLDPGKSGFITLFKEGDFLFYPMPECKIETGEFTKTGKPKTKTIFDKMGLRNLCIEIAKEVKGYKVKAAIEDVGGRGGWSATNNFNFGKVAGWQEMLFIMLGIEPLEVRPQKWQSYMRQGYPDIKKPSSTGKTMISDPKAVAKLIVETEYPNIDFRKTQRSKNVDDNKIDSFLICLYLYRIDNGI